jgi:hypothetical protein
MHFGGRLGYCMHHPIQFIEVRRPADHVSIDGSTLRKYRWVNLIFSLLTYAWIGRVGSQFYQLPLKLWVCKNVRLSCKTAFSG